MNTADTETRRDLSGRRPDRRDPRSLRFGRCARLACGALLSALLVVPGLAAPDPAAATESETATAAPAARTLYLDHVELQGATRTSLDVVYDHLSLQPGQPIDQAALVDAVARLRAGGLFRQVDFYTRPGAERGHIVLVLEVQEHRLDFRWAAGNTNLDGWYLSPAMAVYDNPFGHGGRSDLQWRIGLRHTGLLLRYDQPRVGGGRDYWGARLSAMSTERPYFAGGVEYRHDVDVSGLQGVYGRRFGDDDVLELGLSLETVDVADHARAATASADGAIEIDQDIPAALLPAAVREAVGRDERAVVHVDWQHDTRAAARRAGSPVSGAWGRLKGRLITGDGRAHAGAEADLRLFREAPGGVLAMRLRGAVVGPSATFVDRLYLGGMYTVRGFATHSLSAPGGDTWLWSGSLEYRSTILADARGTKLAGLFFLDAGAAGASDAVDPYPGVAAGVGYGVRMRVWWLDWIGVDVGFPLTDRPLDQRFQASASIGWSF